MRINRNRDIKWNLNEKENVDSSLNNISSMVSTLKSEFDNFSNYFILTEVPADPRGEFKCDLSFATKIKQKFKKIYEECVDAQTKASSNVDSAYSGLIAKELKTIADLEACFNKDFNRTSSDAYIVGRYYWSNGCIKEKTWNEELQMYLKTENDKIIKENVKMKNAKKGEDVDLVTLSGKMETIKDTDYFFRGNVYYSYYIDKDGSVAINKVLYDKKIFRKQPANNEGKNILQSEIIKPVYPVEPINIVNKDAKYGKNVERTLMLNNDGLWEYGTEKKTKVNVDITEGIEKLKKQGIYDGKGDMKVRIDKNGSIYIYKYSQIPGKDENGKLKYVDGPIYKDYIIDSHELVLEELHVDKNGKLVNKDGDIIYNKNNKDRSYKNLDSHFYMDINGNIISDNSDKGEGGVFPIIEYDKVSVERNQSNVVKDIGINDDSVQSVNNGEDESSGYTHRKIYSNNYEPEYVEKSENQQPVHQSAEPPKVEQPKVEQPKVEQPKVEQPKVEPPTVEQPVDELPIEETPEEKTIEDPYKEFISEESQNEEPVYDEEYEEPIPSDEYEETIPSEEVYEEPVSYEEPYEKQITDETEFVETISDEDAFEESFNNFEDNNSNDE